ncbi:MAG: PA2169 family four-helix-bundle protein [Bryobacteraceae bacterium]
MDAADTISCLNGLIETCRNGELGYAEAAHLVHDTQLQTVLEGYAKERAGFVRALQAEVTKLGGTPAESGSVGAAVHRGWMDLKSALTGGSSSAILAACESGEDSAWTHYKEATDSPLSGESRALVDKQWEKIKQAISHLQHLQGELTEKKPD